MRVSPLCLLLSFQIRVAKELVSSDVADFLSRHHIVEEMESFTRQKRKDLVLTHGDPWASNILIKYEDVSTIICLR